MKTFTGIVISTKMTKTATVLVETRWQHPTYKKTVKRSKKYLADNVIGAKDGETVEISEVRPISKNKSFRITKIVKK